jgi:mannosyl-oligosaccharide alpha-1,2-mannosidase
MYNSDLYGSYLDRWLIAADSTIRWIGSHPYGHPEWTLLPSWDGASLQNSMESLAWFAGGNFILGGMITGNQTLVDYGLSIADAAGAMYNSTKTGLGGEFVTWSTTCDAGGENACESDETFRISDGKFRLRPEVLETWYYAYRATKDPKYRDWSWAAFESINRYCRTETGFSSINDVNDPDGGGKSDSQESFVFAEVMKYVYLSHLEVSSVTQQLLITSQSLTLVGCLVSLTRQSYRSQECMGIQHGSTSVAHRRSVKVEIEQYGTDDN